MTVYEAYQLLYSAVFLALVLLAGCMLIRAMIGPRITDRLLSINMLGTMVISGIAVLSRLLDESYLVDVALIYAMISFLAVMMLAEVYIPAARRKGEKPGGKRHG